MKQTFFNRQFSLRFTLLSIFIVLYLLTAVLTLAVRYAAFSDEVGYISRSLMKQASTSVYREVSSEINPIEVQGAFTAKLIEKGVVSENRQELTPYLFNLVSIMPLVRSAFWADEDGNFILVRKESDGTITTETLWRQGANINSAVNQTRDGKIRRLVKSSIDNDMDPRKSPWYTTARSTKAISWIDVYHYIVAKNGITLSVPIIDKNGNVVSALGLLVSLEYLTDAVSNQKVARNGSAFIVSNDERLIAYPHRAPFPAAAHPDDDNLLNIHVSALPLIDQSLDTYKKTLDEYLTVHYAGQDYLVSYMPVKDLGSIHWLIGVIVPKSDFTGFIQRLNRDSFFVWAGIMAVGIILLSIFVSYIVKPIKLLVKETKNIRDFNLDAEINIQSRLKEVNSLKNSLNSMKRGLKHFQKYIPKILVHQLIETGQDMQIGGVKKNLVVMFSDIENFTTIAGNVDPQQLMAQVCEYFEIVTSIIIEEKGTIDKYIGDAVMAFWGAPLVESDPCAHAAKAALRCQTRLVELNKAWRERGWPVFVTRIGIHMGDAIVGNVGSSERLSYTALGDTINITNRLEGINKNYNTKIIVSDTVYAEIKDKFILREVDSVLLKGITHPMNVYELLGDNMQEIKFDIEAFRVEFELGLQTLHQGKHALALEHFNKCLRIYPDDYLVPKFIQQCQENLG